MANSLPRVHIGNDEVINLRIICFPIIDQAESNPEFKELAWTQLSAEFGMQMGRYYAYPPEQRIPYAQWETGEKLKEWYGVANPYPQPSFNKVHPNPIVGMLGVDQLGFKHANGRLLPIGVHFGDGFLSHTEGMDAGPVLDQFVENYFQWDRTWITLMYNKQGNPNHIFGTRGCSPRVTPDYWAKLDSWMQMHIERNLKMHLSMGDLNGIPQGELEGLYSGVADLIGKHGPEHFIFPGEINEGRDTYEGITPAKAETLVNFIRRRHPDILYCLTAYTGYGGVPNYHDVVRNYTPNWQRIYQKHGDRSGRNVDKIRHTFNDGYEFYSDIRPWGYDSEHVGPGKHVSVTENKDDLNAATMGLMAVSAVLSGQLYNYFCSPGIVYDEDFNNMPGFTTVGKLISMLPQHISAGVLHHSGERFNGTSVFGATGNFRVDGRVLDKEFAYAAYGDGNKVRIPIEKSFKGKIIDPTTLEVTEISGRAGNYLPEMTYTDGFVITGNIV